MLENAFHQAPSSIGEPLQRKEDLRFITGKGRYTSDIHVPGALHAVFVRSPHAHARILRIDVAAALEMTGVVAVLTGQDLPQDQVRPLGLDFVARNFDGRPMATPPRYPNRSRWSSRKRGTLPRTPPSRFPSNTRIGRRSSA